jgi:CBS-domain-containing membrane protein
MSVIGITPEDIDGVLAEYGDALDISREDVDALVQRLIARAQTRGTRR